MIELLELSEDAWKAITDALGSLPDDHLAPAPVCQRINELKDVLIPLTERVDLPAKDRAVLLTFCMSERRIQNFIELMTLWDSRTRR